MWFIINHLTDINDIILKITSKHFQQRMSWLPQRWRTQRNAIRHANCRIQRVIKILNAPCTASAVCLLECLLIQQPLRVETTALIKASWDVITNLSHSAARVGVTWNHRVDRLAILSKRMGCWPSVQTSNQSRLPAEFKHIIKRRKRN